VTGQNGFGTQGVAGQNALNQGQANTNATNNNRMTYYNGQWWYYSPNNSWMYYRNNSWYPYSAEQSTPYTTGYRGTASSGQSRFYTDENGMRYRRDYSPNTSGMNMSGSAGTQSQSGMPGPNESPERNANMGQGSMSR
jgi:hypothetical protein